MVYNNDDNNNNNNNNLTYPALLCSALYTYSWIHPVIPLLTLTDLCMYIAWPGLELALPYPYRAYIPFLYLHNREVLFWTLGPGGGVLERKPRNKEAVNSSPLYPSPFIRFQHRLW